MREKKLFRVDEKYVILDRQKYKVSLEFGTNGNNKIKRKIEKKMKIETWRRRNDSTLRLI